MDKIKKNIGIISLLIAIVAVIITFFKSTVGLVFYIIALAIALFDLIKGYKAEDLTPKEFLAVAVKEKLFSVIVVGGTIVYLFVFYFANANQLIDAAYNAF